MIQCDKFTFPNNNSVMLDYSNCESLLETKRLYFGKNIKQFKGSVKAMIFRNKNDDLEGVVFKVKNNFGKVYYLVVNKDKIYFRLSASKCFEVIPTLKKDKRSRIQSIINLKV